MVSDKRWLLPDGIDELLPDQAGAVEALRRALLDECARWGYRYVIPPLVEFTDSLLVGLGADLELLTCKFSDRNSGKTLGVRADMTPQVARIDAHSLAEDGVTRLCYSGSTLHSTAQSVLSGRSPIQLGAELFGCADIAADLEVIELMLTLLERADMVEQHGPVTLDVGHVGVYEAVLRDAGIDAEVADAVFDALQRKSLPDLEAVFAGEQSELQNLLVTLVNLHGGVDVLDRARDSLKGIADAQSALDQLEQVVATVAASHPDVAVYIDLAELRGFRYHTGLVFAAYLEGFGAAVAKGGRYDNVGAVFGRNRPATGFAFDLKALTAASGHQSGTENWISAPESNDPKLVARIRELRAVGRTVVLALNGQSDARCREQLVDVDGDWICQPLGPGEGE